MEKKNKQLDLGEGSGTAATAAKKKSLHERLRRPTWLPDGWDMGVEVDKDGSKHKYFTSPDSGCTFHSQWEVWHHLKVTFFDVYESDGTSFSKQNIQTEVAQVQSATEWLPQEWILEIKTRASGEQAGQNYKCYYDPYTGCRFYSKSEVLRFLDLGNSYNPTSAEKERFDVSRKDFVLARIEYSPDGLPQGWKKETIHRKGKDNRIRTDQFYTDPVKQNVFRNIMDAKDYIETGKLAKYAYGPRRKSIRERYTLREESPPPIPIDELNSLSTSRNQRLFVEEAQMSNAAVVIEINDSPERVQSPPSSEAPFS